jgi:hypothetical protein
MKCGKNMFSNCLPLVDTCVLHVSTLLVLMVACVCVCFFFAGEGDKMGYFESVILSRFGPKRYEVTGEWRKLHNEELCDL